MTFYRNVLLATGTIAIVYIMLKLFIKKGKDASKKTSETVEDEVKNEQTDGKIKEKTDAAIMEPSKKKHKLVNWRTEGKERAMTIFKPKPNFFIAFQVNDIGIHQKVKKLQEKLIAKNPALFPAIVNVSTLHVTLAVTHLANEKDIKNLRDKLDEWAEKGVKTYFEKPCVLNFTGVKTFNNAVAYVALEECENFKKISDLSENINDVLSSAGYSTDKRSFTPHLTFLKLSKDIKLMKIRKNFISDFEVLKECKEHFGKQEVTHLQLLSMNEPKDKFGYYKSFHQIKVSDAVKAEVDHSECCTPIPRPKLSKKR